MSKRNCICKWLYECWAAKEGAAFILLTFYTTSGCIMIQLIMTWIWWLSYPVSESVCNAAQSERCAVMGPLSFCVRKCKHQQISAKWMHSLTTASQYNLLTGEMSQSINCFKGNRIEYWTNFPGRLIKPHPHRLDFEKIRLNRVEGGTMRHCFMQAKCFS